MIESPLTSSAMPTVPLVVDCDSCLHQTNHPDMDALATVADKPARLPNVTATKYFESKRTVDLLIASLLTVVAIPIVATVAILILVCDGRPIFYRQIRVGKQGRLFKILKFRTMRPHAEKHTGAVWSSPTDPRVSRLGRWLRCCHLDELPQLINVLAGQMSLVGPRPERPEFVGTLAAEVPGYMQRIQVRPGITGIAQLQLGYDESIVGIPEKVGCDLQYIQTASLRQDIGLILATIPYIVGQIYFKVTSKRKDATEAASGQQSEQAIALTRNVA